MKAYTRFSFIGLKVSPATGKLPESEAACFAHEGDARGFGRLYQLHSGRVYGLCSRIVKDPVEAEDLTHDSFLHTIRMIQSFRRESLFSTRLH